MLSAPVLALFSVSFLALLAASYTDIKHRIVPNWLSLTLVPLGVVLNGWLSVQLNDMTPVLLSIAAAVLGFGFAYLLYRFGVWAGGDVKLFTGLAALNPVSPALMFHAGLLPELFSTYAPHLPLFPFTFFVFSALAFLPAGALLGISAVFSNRKLRTEAGARLKQNLRQGMVTALWLAGVSTSLLAFGAPGWLVVAVLLAGFFLGTSLRASGGLFFALLAVAVQPAQAPAFLFSAATYLVVVLALLGMLFFVWIGRKALVTSKKISNLEEGEIPAEFIYIENEKPLRRQATGIQTIIKHLTHKDFGSLRRALRAPQQTLASPMRARGLDKEEIRALQEYAKGGKLEDRISVKHAAPMVPAMLLAYAFLSMAGDVLWNTVL